MKRILAVTFLFVLLNSVVLAQTRKPNIVFLLADDVGCEVLGCYGGTSYPTPNLDRLATNGLRFQHCYSMPVCHPSRTTLMLGRYPMHTGRPKWGSFPDALEGETVAHAMKEAGYATAVAGKWQLTLLGNDLDHPHHLGFDQYALFGWHEGPRYFDPLIWQNGQRRKDTEGEYGPDLYVDFLIDFFEQNRDQPFFAFYSMALCHDVTDDLKAPVPYAPGKDRYLNYAEMAKSMDECVGRIISALERLDLREETLLVFTGDNGTPKASIIRAKRVKGKNGKDKWAYIREPFTSMQNGEAVRGGKGELTDDGTNVPLICNWPGTIDGGKVVDDLIDFSDFPPTFVELGGGAVPAASDIDGRSFASRLLEDKPGPRVWACSEHRGKYWVRTRRWKLYNNGSFHDMKQDPEEQKDLSGNVPPQSDHSRLKAALESL